jgi:hypothetical protein
MYTHEEIKLQIWKFDGIKVEIPSGMYRCDWPQFAKMRDTNETTVTQYQDLSDDTA